MIYYLNNLICLNILTREPLFLISHGNTPVTEIPGVYNIR